MAFHDLRTDYAGRGGPMFRLALRTGVLTVLTLGIYRFWMKTRMRRYYWSAIRPGGLPLEFTGRPTEMLTGFLTAVVFLAFYIGIVNLVLMFFSFSLFNGEAPAYAVSFIGLAPVIFFAQYRARRYILARTRWRGIRFGLEPGVKGYVWRATWWWLLALSTGGLLWPVKTFALEKYRTDRMWYGDAQFKQTGGLFSLMTAMKHVWLGAALIAAGTLAAGLSEEPVWFVGAAMGGVWAVLGLAYWRAQSFKRLLEGKRLGETGFRSHARGGRIVGIYLTGSMAISAIMSALLFGIGIAIGIALALIDPALLADGLEDLSSLGALPGWVFPIVGLVFYFTVFVLWGVLREVFITMPVARHLAETTEIVNPDALAGIRQRARDEFVEAEGFADALPLGDGI
ncbi:DUF898 family protein [Sinisalibacter aestuarii]|uniref:Membrane protein n=1 Tax=Sinisalibacter aestuarii TaxID=2949426 RepID=A0ABQ5LU76_9RHOB|nr:DUF898 family protein [Sinisalibacter aestuarii]GKY88527.1 membrane protein [Sinisalibacter aestuarii]